MHYNLKLAETSFRKLNRYADVKIQNKSKVCH